MSFHGAKIDFQVARDKTNKDVSFLMMSLPMVVILMVKMRVLGTCGDEKNILTLRRSFVDIALNVTKDSGQMQNVRGKLINRKRIGIVT